MKTRSVNPRNTHGVSRRELLYAGLAAGAALSAWPLYTPSTLWGGDVGAPRRGGTLRVRGSDPVHFDPHLTINNYTNYLLRFTHSRLVRHRVGAECTPTSLSSPRPGRHMSPYVKNYGPNHSFDYGSRAAALWLNR